MRHTTIPNASDPTAFFGCWALVAGDAGNLAEIAYRVGFSDQAHCSRRVKHHLGMMPSAYRAVCS